MRKSDRQNYILEQMQSANPDQVISTKDLAEHFDVSETTIRRDFQELASAGLLQRQHGGAHSVKSISYTHKGNVGILLGSRIDKYSDPFYNLVLQGADRKLNEFGYHVAYIKTFYDVHSTVQAQKLLEAFPIDGLILLGSSQDESVEYLRQNVSPVVTVTDRYGTNDDMVLFDGFTGMHNMLGHLASLGYRCPAYISGQTDLRYDGFIKGLETFNFLNDKQLHKILTPSPAGWIPELGEEGARLIMSEDGVKPDVIVCASDRLAIGAMRWLQQNGYRVPDDVAVTGFDNIHDSEFTFPPLTTVHVHKTLLGEIAAERIVRRIENPSEVYLHITIPTKLVARQSCGSKR